MERRQQRSDHQGQALFYQLDTSRQRAALEAMILADDSGLCVASSGDAEICDELAAHVALVCEQVPFFQGTVRSPTRQAGLYTKRDVYMKRLTIDGEELYLCAVGGNPAMRVFELHRSESGVTRILAAN